MTLLSSRPRGVGRRFARAAACALVILGASSSPSRALAGELESRSLFAEGRRLRTDGKCADAIVLFRKALETYPDGLGALRNVAECEVETGKFASARRDYADLRIAVLRSTSPKYEGWEKDAQESYDQLTKRVARVTIDVSGERPEGLRIQLNGQPFDLRLAGVELEQDDGPIVVEALVGDRTLLTRRTEAKEASRQTLTLELPKLPPTPPPASTAPTAPLRHDEPVPPRPSRSGTPMRVGGGIALGIGGLGVVGALASIGIRQSALSSIDSVCPSHRHCPASVSGDVSRGKTASTLFDVFAATAAVGTGVGLALVLAAPSSSKAERTTGSVDLHVGAGPTGAGFSLAGSFR